MKTSIALFRDNFAASWCIRIAGSYLDDAIAVIIPYLFNKIACCEYKYNALIFSRTKQKLNNLT